MEELFKQSQQTELLQFWSYPSHPLECPYGNQKVSNVKHIDQIYLPIIENEVWDLTALLKYLGKSFYHAT